MAPAPASRLVILPLLPEFSTWAGGESYVCNLLDLLARARAGGIAVPWVALYIFDREQALVKRLAGHPAVGLTIGTDRVVRDLSPAYLAAHGLDTAALSQDSTAAAVAAQIAAAVSFPITYPHFPALFPRPLYWIPDFQHKHLPQFFQADEIALRNHIFGGIAGAPVDLLLSSQAAAADFARFYPGAPTRCHVWSFVSMLDAAADTADPAEMRARHGLPARYLYLANQFWAHKDHTTAFQALQRVRAQDVPVMLVCTGHMDDNRDPAYIGRLTGMLDAAGLRSSVRLLGLVPRRDQLAIFRGAAAVVQPSRFEGWSTVVEDARALGVPVLLSDLAVHEEQMPDNPWRFRTGDAADLAARMMSAWQTLPPTPDPAREAAAAAAMVPRRQATAARFAAVIDRIAATA